MPSKPPTLVNRATQEARAARAAAAQAYNGQTYDSEWRRASKRFLRNNPLCAHCMRDGRITAATQTDHVIPIKQAPERRMDPTNWQSLCGPCHSKKTWDENQQLYRGKRD